jgi:hypothetical protein
MNLHRLILALGLGLPIGTACTLDNDMGSADPGLYWGWVCADGGTPIPASTPIDYIASGSCGAGGPFMVNVDGCEMFGTWSTLGLSDVESARTTSSPGLGGWSISGTAGVPDGGASWKCSATPAASGDLTFACSDATTSATTCQSTLTPAGNR